MLRLAFNEEDAEWQQVMTVFSGILSDSIMSRSVWRVSKN